MTGAAGAAAGAMRILSWNVNSIRARDDHLLRLVRDHAPDVICLQETRVENALFPVAPLAALGYRHAAIHGMKGYNGVAILSRRPFRRTGRPEWCGRRDCRHVCVELADGLEIHNVYVPAGGDVPDPSVNEKFAHKLRFLSEMAAWWDARRRPGARVVLAGDLNVAPLETDVWSHERLRRVVTHTPVEVEHLSRLAAAHGWIDAVRRFVPPSQRLYSWWSYRARDWAAADRGRRLDHIWVTPALESRLAGAWIAREVRGWTRPSDHAPVFADLSL